MGYQSDSSFGDLTTWNTSMPAGSWVGFMESHDEERMGYKQTQWGSGTLKTSIADRMKQLATNAAFFLTVSGPKMIWQFGELGYDYSINSNYAGTSTSNDYRTNPKPVKWDYYNVTERKGLYNTYSKLLALRNNNPELFSQSAFGGWNVTQSYWSQGRSITLHASDGKRLVVVGNFTDSAVSVSASFGETGTWNDYMNGGTLSVSSSTQSISVPAHEFKIYTNFK
jgi:hypothetical protein